MTKEQKWELYNNCIGEYEDKINTETDERIKAFWEGALFGLKLGRIIMNWEGEYHDKSKRVFQNRGRLQV